jgi:heme A synthase
MKAYPAWFYQVVIVILVTLFLSGVLLIPTTFDMRFEWDVIWRLTGQQRLISVATHTTSSYLLFLIIGALSTIHMRAGFIKRKNKISGVLLVLCFFVMMLSGVGLFYLADEELITLASLVHMVLGLLLPLVFIMHFINGKKLKKLVVRN